MERMLAQYCMDRFWSDYAIHYFPQMMHDFPDGNEAERFHIMFTVMRIFTLVFSAAFCGLFGWIIKKLSSQSIKREFKREFLT